MPFEVSGMEATIARFQRAAVESEESVKAAVKAGAQYVADCLNEKAPEGETHSLKGSVKPGPVQYNAAEGYYCKVTPVGNNKKNGEPLAKIGNILEYGRSYGKTEKPGIGWFHPTVLAAEKDAQEVMQTTFDARIGGS